MRACVTDARATVYVCVHMRKEVYDKEKMCVYALKICYSVGQTERFGILVYPYGE